MADVVFAHPGIMGAHGMVASPHYLASFAGARILLEGGNEIDAAIACNAVLNVVYPHMCSPGGDLFMLIPPRGAAAPVALNASDRAPYAATREYFLARGMKTILGRGGEARPGHCHGCGERNLYWGGRSPQ